MIDTPRSSNRSLATGCSAGCSDSQHTHFAPNNPKLQSLHFSSLPPHPLQHVQSLSCLRFCPKGPNAAHHAALRIHATCTLWRSEIALEGWVFPSVLALVSELRSQRLESRLHRSVCPSESSSHPPTTAAPLPLHSSLNSSGFLILDNLRCEGRIRAS